MQRARWYIGCDPIGMISNDRVISGKTYSDFGDEKMGYLFVDRVGDLYSERTDLLASLELRAAACRGTHDVGANKCCRTV